MGCNMGDMTNYDWTTDDTLSEGQIRERWATEGWEPVESLERPHTSIETFEVGARNEPVWRVSEIFDTVHVRTTTAA